MDRRVAGSQGPPGPFPQLRINHEKGEETKETPPAGTLSLATSGCSDMSQAGQPESAWAGIVEAEQNRPELRVVETD